MDDLTWRERMKVFRRRRSMRQQDLADATGISRSTIASIEAGRQGCTVDKLLKISAALGISMGCLFGEEPHARAGAKSAVPRPMSNCGYDYDISLAESRPGSDDS